MISLGFDQSYTRTGVTVVEGNSINDGKILFVKSYDFKGMKTKTEKRRFIAKLTRKLIEKFKPDVILVERIRMYTQGFVSTVYMKATASLIASIVDNAYPETVYSVDTRSWKSRVCGNSSGMHKADKGVSVRYIMKRFGKTYNDDAADSICIALYGLDFERLKEKKLLKKED